MRIEVVDEGVGLADAFRKSVEDSELTFNTLTMRQMYIHSVISCTIDHKSGIFYLKFMDESQVILNPTDDELKGK